MVLEAAVAVASTALAPALLLLLVLVLAGNSIVWAGIQLSLGMEEVPCALALGR
jgi:hypothetical protein